MLERIVFLHIEDADLAVYAAGDIDEVVEANGEAIWKSELGLGDETQGLVEKCFVLGFCGIGNWCFILLIAVIGSMAFAVGIAVCDISPSNEVVKVFALRTVSISQSHIEGTLSYQSNVHRVIVHNEKLSIA